MNSTLPLTLVVDDDPAIVATVSGMLEQSGYRVLTAQDGEEALAIIECEHPHFLITDWSMPRMTGLELCRRVRAATLPHYTYIIMLTGRSGSDNLVTGLQAGADEFVCKSALQTELAPRLQTGQRVIDLEQQLVALAKTDMLTGLPTRRAFMEQFERELGRARRYHTPLACVLLDIDFFKKINDTHGHGAGDRVLWAVADLVRGSVRVIDTVGRYGGEEFCALLPETQEHSAIIWAERTRRKVEEALFPVNGQDLRVTASFGVAQLLDDTARPGDLIELADQALLVAKQSGRNCVVRYSDLHATSSLPLDDLREARQVLRHLRARDAMSTVVACLRENDPVATATEFFLRFRINSAPVVNEAGKLSGILSEKDVLSMLTSPDAWQRPIREVMKPHVVWYDEQAPLETIYDFLCRVTIRRVIIVRDGYPVGTISRGTLLRWYANWLRLREASLDGPESAADRARRRTHLAETAKRLADCGASLQREIVTRPTDEELAPLLVASVSELQELSSDLLAGSQQQDCGAGSLFSANPTDPLDPPHAGLPAELAR